MVAVTGFSPGVEALPVANVSRLDSRCEPSAATVPMRGLEVKSALLNPAPNALHIADNHRCAGTDGRRVHRLVPSFAAAATSLRRRHHAGAARVRPRRPTPSTQPTPCWSDQIAVSASPTQGAGRATARLTLMFTLAGGAEPCTLTGTRESTRALAARRFMPSPRRAGTWAACRPTSTCRRPSSCRCRRRGRPSWRGCRFDADGNACPTYTDLAVSPPDIVQVFTVPATIDACQLQVHPVTAG